MTAYFLLLALVCAGFAVIAALRIIAWHQQMKSYKQRQRHFEETGELIDLEFFKSGYKLKK